MNLAENNGLEKSKPAIETIVLYVAAAVVALMGLALLVDNIYMYTTTLAQYVTQGYPKAEVTKQLLPSMLLPGIFEPIAVYGGIALVLFYLGVINKKVTWCLTSFNSGKSNNNADDKSEMDVLGIDVDNVPTAESTESVDEYNDPVNTNP